jgi:hypothetical protein
MSKIAIQIRLDENTHARVKSIAEKELRSLNAQMEYFIIKGIEQWEAGHAPVTVAESPDRP